MSSAPASDDPVNLSDRGPGQPDQVPLVRLLAMAVALGLQDLHDHLAAAGYPDLRPVHGFALNAVGAGARTASELSGALRMTKQGAAKVVATLVGNGYLEPAPSGADARRKPLTLTARGRAAIAASESVQHRIEGSWAAAIGDEELQAVRAGLLAAVLSANGGRLPAPRPTW